MIQSKASSPHPRPTNSHNKINQHHSKVVINNLMETMRDTIAEYQSHKDASKAFKVVRQLEKVIDALFDSVAADELLDENEIETVMNLCRQFYDNPTIKEVKSLSLKQIKNDGPALKRVESMPMAPKHGEEHEELEHSKIFEKKNFHFKEGGSKLGIPLKGLLEESILGHSKIEEKNHMENHHLKEESLLKSVLLTSTNQVTVNPKSELIKLFERMKEELGNSKIDEPYEYYLQIKNFANTRTLHKDDLMFYEQMMKDNARLLDDIECYYADSQVILRELQDEEGYNLESVKKNFMVKYKTVDGQVSLKMEGLVDVPVFNMLALIYEIEGYSSWVPFCKDAREMKHISRTSKAGWIKLNMPPPLSNREAYIYGVGFNRVFQDGTILLVSKSIHNDEKTARRHGIDIPPENKLARLDLIYMGGAITVLARDKIKLQLVVRFDPKIKFIPNSVINWFVRKTAQYLLEVLVTKAKNFKGSLWESKIQEKRDFYGWLELEIDKYFSEKEQAEQQQKEGFFT